MTSTSTTASPKPHRQWAPSTFLDGRGGRRPQQILDLLRHPPKPRFMGMRKLGVTRDNGEKIGNIFHRSIRRILGITWTQVIDEHITNDSVWRRFCHIPSLRNQFAKRQLTFIGKIERNSDSQIPTRLLTAWCDHPRRRGAPLQRNKKNLVKNLQLIVPSVPNNGRLSSWALLALDSSYWNHLISQLGTQPTDWEREVPGTENYTAPPTPPPRNRAPPPIIRRRRRRHPRPRFYLPFHANARPPLRGSMNTVLNGILIRWE